MEKNLISKAWNIFIFLLFRSKICACYEVLCTGKITVQSDIIRMNSKLTVRCQSDTEHCNQHFGIRYNGQLIYERKNCSEITTQILIDQPKSSLLCLTKKNNKWHALCGKDIKAGYLPENPTFHCISFQNSKSVECYLTGTRETYLPTNYTITFSNGTSEFLQYDMTKERHITIPLSVFNEAMTYTVNVNGSNAVGKSHNVSSFSVWGSVIPRTPEIQKISFPNASLYPEVHCKLLDSSVRPSVRFRRAHASSDWKESKVGLVERGIIMLQDELDTLMPYQFTLSVCYCSANCSLWSNIFNLTSPGKVPTNKPDVWRRIKRSNFYGLQNVTVLWKPYTPEHGSGTLLGYRLLYEVEQQIQEVNCTARETRHMLQLPLEGSVVTVSAVTSGGVSPPASVSLTSSGEPPPFITHLDTPAEGSVRLCWNLSRNFSGFEGILGFVVQWQQNSVDLRWRKMGKNLNCTSLEDMDAGVLYNISLYAEYRHGISNHALVQVYSNELKPTTGPNVTKTTLENNKIRIEWDEIRPEQKRGWIRNYTVYFQRHRDRAFIQSKTVPSTFSRYLISELWEPLECFDVLVSAWNSAGEGPKGNSATCCYRRDLVDITDGMAAALCLMVVVVLILSVSLIYLKSVRQRMIKMCMSIGFSWLGENLPKFDNSNAIKLLQDDSYSHWEHLPSESDPPLTPLEELNPSWQRHDSYPAFLHVPESPTGNQCCEDSPYKPQLLTSIQGYQDDLKSTQEEVFEEDQLTLLVSHTGHHTWDSASVPAMHGCLSSFMATDGTIRFLSVSKDFSSPFAFDEESLMNDNTAVGFGKVEQKTLLTAANGHESCPRLPVFNLKL